MLHCYFHRKMATSTTHRSTLLRPQWESNPEPWFTEAAANSCITVRLSFIKIHSSLFTGRNYLHYYRGLCFQGRPTMLEFRKGFVLYPE